MGIKKKSAELCDSVDRDVALQLYQSKRCNKKCCASTETSGTFGAG